MSYVSDVLKIAKNINAQMESLTAPFKVRLAESNMNELYDTMITNKSLRRKTEKLCCHPGGKGAGNLLCLTRML